ILHLLDVTFICAPKGNRIWTLAPFTVDFYVSVESLRLFSVIKQMRTSCRLNIPEVDDAIVEVRRAYADEDDTSEAGWALKRRNDGLIHPVTLSSRGVINRNCGSIEPFFVKQLHIILVCGNVG
ncbi:hypothetical protein PRIPAC_78068, partial [Pristionchus pacificus]|uniref:Uncharacterized protein n=1 Tax=Pristionchus pacificus TaxID=54126 RepID=A0A2A6CMD6_PRIPA